MHDLLSTILGHALERGQVPVNAAKGVRLPKAERAELEILTDGEFLALHAAMSDRYKPLVWLLAATGMRWGEATAPQWRDVHETHIDVRQAWKHDEEGHKRILGTPKTRQGRRRIETTKAVVESLGERGAAGDFVFTNTRGKPIVYHTFHRSLWSPAASRAGIDPAPKTHGLRHVRAAARGSSSAGGPASVAVDRSPVGTGRGSAGTAGDRRSSDARARLRRSTGDEGGVSRVASRD
ncbi:hypothetical protein GCM10028787_03820 [Brachybacterium horti]